MIYNAYAASHHSRPEFDQIERELIEWKDIPTDEQENRVEACKRIWNVILGSLTTCQAKAPSEDLHLQKLGLTSLPTKVLERMNYLKVLNISDNRISDASMIPKLSGLKKIDCSGNRISDLFALVFPKELGAKVKRLVKQIERAEQEIVGLPQVQLAHVMNPQYNKKVVGKPLRDRLISYKNQLEQLLSCGKVFRDLEVLSLGRNHISDVTSMRKIFFPNLKGVDCDLSNNQITDPSIQDRFSGVILAGNPVYVTSHHAPEELEMIEKELQEWETTGCKAEACRRIRQAILGKTTVFTKESISKDTGRRDLTCYNVLDLSRLGLSSLPIKILEKMSYIDVLNLSCNNIQDASCIPAMPNLQALHFSDNGISDITPFLQKVFPKLHSVSFSGNEILDFTGLKKGGNFPLLTSIDARDNTPLNATQEFEKQWLARKKEQRSNDKARFSRTVTSRNLLDNGQPSFRLSKKASVARGV